MRKLLILIAIMTMCDAYGETVFWFTDDNTYYTSTTCTITSGNNITKPSSNPTKKGYRLMGWTIPTSGPAYLVSQLFANPTIAGYSYENTSTNWTVSFSYGEVSGTSFFSKYDSSRVQQTYSSNINYVGYCWCQITSFTANGYTATVSNFPWYCSVQQQVATSLESCMQTCGLAVKSNNGKVLKTLLGMSTN